MSQQRVRGTVGLFESIGLNSRKICAQVSINGVETYSLCYAFRALKTPPKYELFGQHRNLIQVWEFKIRIFSRTLDLSVLPHFPLRYESRIFGRNFLVTSEGEYRTFMELKPGSRSFQLDDFKFTHRDYQSHINFSCPPERTHQAILIAAILFTPPHFNEPE